MTLARKVSAVEATLTPTELVVAWLSEAHAHGSLEAAIAALLAEPLALPPLDRLARAAQASASVRSKSLPTEERTRSIDTAESRP